MKIRSLNTFFFACALLCSCQNLERAKNRAIKNGASLIQSKQGPNYNYTIDIPTGWVTYDTTLQDLKIRLIIAPGSLDRDKPRGNILIAWMEGDEVGEFTTRNIKNVKEEMPGSNCPVIQGLIALTGKPDGGCNKIVQFSKKSEAQYIYYQSIKIRAHPLPPPR